jgi:hypothetical protein
MVLSGIIKPKLMKYLFLVFLLTYCGLYLKAQSTANGIEGKVSFVTSQNVYVKFESTENISVGDTLFILKESVITPLLLVKDLSSISCVCTLLSTQNIVVDTKVLARPKAIKKDLLEEIAVKTAVQPVNSADSSSVKKDIPKDLKQDISGRIAISSYSNFSNVSDFSQRMRYNFSLNAQHIGDSKISAETYISFVHKLKQWSQVKENVFNGLKIYSLAFNYAINKNNSVWLGRKINPKLSSVGVIDGLQYETKFKSITAGIIAGTRPDYNNFGFNADLLQFGGYIGHDYTNLKGSAQSSIAMVEQRNKNFTDRRFAYFQHSNSLLKNLYLFGSLEMDLYNQVSNLQDSSLSQDNAPKLSNLYVSLRYKVIKQLSLSLSYSERKNIIYYESYKDIVSRLLETSKMQGFTFQVNYRPVNNISIGSNAGYRFSKQDPRPSKNLYTYLTINNVPGLNVATTLSATLAETSYLSSNIYSLGISRDLVPGKVNAGAGYRYVHYKFQNAEMALTQNMGEFNMTWRILKKLSCSLNYEGTFEKSRNYNLIYANITQRF